MNTGTELSRPGLSPTVPMPRIRAEPFASEPVEETSSDGATWFSWRMSFAPLFCSVSALTAEIATGTSDSSWARPCAVTTIGASALSSVVSAASCAKAGTETAATAIDTPSALLRKRRAARREEVVITGTPLNISLFLLPAEHIENDPPIQPEACICVVFRGVMLFGHRRGSGAPHAGRVSGARRSGFP